MYKINRRGGGGSKNRILGRTQKLCKKNNLFYKWRHDYDNVVDVAEVWVYIVIFSEIKMRFWI